MTTTEKKAIEVALEALSRAASHAALAKGEANSARNRAEAAYGAVLDAERSVAAATKSLVCILDAAKLAREEKS